MNKERKLPRRMTHGATMGSGQSSGKEKGLLPIPQLPSAGSEDPEGRLENSSFFKKLVFIVLYCSIFHSSLIAT